ncbi:MAG: tetratricopeptide repeat protein [Chryseotalea sp.]
MRFKYFLIFLFFSGAVWAQGISLDTLKTKKIIEFIYKGKYAEANKLIQGIEEQYQHVSITPEYVQFLIDIGGVFGETGNYESGQQFLFTALSLANQKNYEAEKAKALLEIGYIYYFLNQYDKGIEYGKNALTIAENRKDSALIGTAYNLLGIFYLKQNQPEESLNSLEKSLAIRKKLNNIRGVASTLSNIALYYEYKKDYGKALELQKKSLDIDIKLKNTYGIAWSKQMTGNLLTEMNRTDEAVLYLENARRDADSLKAKEITLQVYLSLSKLYAKTKAYDKAYSFSEKYNLLRDSIYNSGLAGKVLLYQQSYEMQDRDKQILIQQTTLKEQKKFFWLLGFTLIMMMVLFLFYYRAYRKTKSLYRAVAEQNEEIQTQSEELTESNNILHALNLQIEEQKEELQAQAEELIESNQTILSLNEKLHSDIELKKEELYKTNQELVKHNHELLQFSFTVSHNLRGPVARMLGLMNLIAMTGQADEKEKMLGLLKQATTELDGILKDLHLIIDSRNDLMRVKEKILWEEKWNNCLFLLQENLRIVKDLAIDFSKAPVIYSVKPVVQNVLYNLVSNAIKYRSPERELKIKISTYRKDKETYLQVTDNGLGLDLSQHRNDIFKLYKRFHPHIPGKGLGLYLVKTQVEAVGGHIEVESVLNEGTTFTVRFSDAENLASQVFLDCEAAQLSFNANINSTIILWKKAITEEEYKMVFGEVLRTLQIYNTPAWIADLRKQGKLTPESQQWFLENVLPQAVSAGLCRIGTVGFIDPIRSDYFNRVKNLCDKLGVSLHNFTEMEDALNWMHEQRSR